MWNYSFWQLFNILRVCCVCVCPTEGVIRLGSQETAYQKTVKVASVCLSGPVFLMVSIFHVLHLSSHDVRYVQICHSLISKIARVYFSCAMSSSPHLLLCPCHPDSILHQLFIVRFLGSMEVRATESADVISETMRQILAARAIHNIFRMTESHLLVTCECLKYETLCVCLGLSCSCEARPSDRKLGVWL